MSLVSKSSYPPPPNIFWNYRYKLSLSLSFYLIFPSQYFVIPFSPHIVGKLDLVVSLACIILGSLSFDLSYSSSNVCDQESLQGESICLRLQRRRHPEIWHSNIVFDLLSETSFSHLITSCSIFKFFSAF